MQNITFGIGQTVYKSMVMHTISQPVFTLSTTLDLKFGICLILGDQTHQLHSQPHVLLPKAHYRRGAALLALGRADEALAAHRASALAWPRRADAAAAAAMAAAASSASPEHLAEVLALLCFLAM